MWRSFSLWPAPESESDNSKKPDNLEQNKEQETVLKTNNKLETGHPNNSKNSDKLEQEKAQELALKMKAELEKVDPNTENLEFIRLYSLEKLISEKKELLEKIKSTSFKTLEKERKNPVPHLTNMLYAFHITKEMERREQVKFTEDQQALIDRFHSILKIKYSVWIKSF